MVAERGRTVTPEEIANELGLDLSSITHLEKLKLLSSQLSDLTVEMMSDGRKFETRTRQTPATASYEASTRACTGH